MPRIIWAEMTVELTFHIARLHNVVGVMKKAWRTLFCTILRGGKILGLIQGFFLPIRFNLLWRVENWETLFDVWSCFKLFEWVNVLKTKSLGCKPTKTSSSSYPYCFLLVDVKQQPEAIKSVEAINKHAKLFESCRELRHKQ